MGPSGAQSLVALQVVTYNVLSLLDGSRASQAGLHGQVGRPTLLQAALISAEVHIAGLQECRTPAGCMHVGAYTRFASGCDDRTCFGVELWVRKDGPCRPESVVVLHASPTVLIASLIYCGPALSSLCWPWASPQSFDWYST